MRRRVRAVVATVTVLLVAGLALAALGSLPGDDPRRPGTGPQAATMAHGMPGMPGRGMHGTSVADEYDFLAEMVVHHEEAVAAARHLARSERAAMREFGTSIVASQSAQIDLMRAWLADWYPDGSGDVDYHPMMRDLTGLTGDRLDRAFLDDMIGHHMGAVMRSQQLLVRGLADHDEVAALARTIRDEQHAEIRQMQRWRHDWFGTSRGMHRSTATG